jgi:probable F420-dependent oxidoreductase
MMTEHVEVGVQLWPQHTTLSDLVDAWRAAEKLGVDSIWTWDHFFPITEDRDGPHFEGWSLLAAKAALTSSAWIGVLVTSIAYRNPDLLADMARTIDHVAGGRVVIGLGAGWYEKDYAEYGYEMADGPQRLRELEDGVRRVRERIRRLNPPPVGDLPILVGGGGEQVTLRIVAEHADWWNTFGPVENWAQKNAVLDEWCDRIGRDPGEILRTALIQTEDDWSRAGEFVEAGARHLIVGFGPPFDLDPVERVLQAVGR